MGFRGLVPSEYSSGTKTWRGRITGTGNANLRTHFVESAWSYRHRPTLGPTIAKRHVGVEPEVLARAWRAQRRLCTKFRRLAARKNSQETVAVAIARELSGFLWAEMTASAPHAPGHRRSRIDPRTGCANPFTRTRR